MPKPLGLLAGLACLAIACGDSGDDASADASASGTDASGVDAALEDAGSPDAPPAGLYSITGDCDELDTELTADSPSTFANHLIFDHLYTDDDFDLLTPGGQEIILDDNLGGSSILSEVFAYENLASCEGAVLLKTEREIDYAVDGKKTDFLAEIDGLKIGVSVVRAQTFPLGSELSVADATALLEGKLADILESTANVATADAWGKQILAVIVYNDQHATSLQTALPAIDAAVRADTIVWLTVTDGPDDVIY